ncbi:MAG TPA: hypothetical protein VHC42_06935 [Rhizomicrobium sp.]|nr:hypothetical protein [Rhizomicrobium sp.]
MTAARAGAASITLLLALACAACLARIAATLGLHVSFDPNEGWNAYRAMAAMGGGPLYPPAGSLVFNNYPPLSFYFVGAVGKALGDYVVAGRIVSLAATLAIAAEIYLCLRLMGAGARASLFAALAFVGGLLAFSDYVGMDDPQLLGHAIGLLGLIVLLREPRTPAAAICAALAMALAGFVKHNLVAEPLALTAWLVLFDRRSAAWFVASGAVFAIAGLIAFRLAYGAGLLEHLASARLWSVALLAKNAQDWLVWSEIPLLGLAALLWLSPRDSRVVLCALYALVSAAVAAVFAGGAGVDANIWFDAAVALGLGQGLALEAMGANARLRAAAELAFVVPLVAGLALDWDGAWLERGFWLHPLSDERLSAAADIAFLRAQDGPALCEELALCYWAGKAEAADLFNLGQAFATGARDDRSFAAAIADGRYSAAQFDSPSGVALTPRIFRAFRTTYRIGRSGEDGVILVPRR